MPVENSRPSGVVESPRKSPVKKTVSEKDPVSFALPNRAISAPWSHGSNASEPRFNFQPQVSENSREISETDIVSVSAEEEPEILSIQNGKVEGDSPSDMSENLIGSYDKLAMDRKNREFEALSSDRRRSIDLSNRKNGELRTVEPDGKKLWRRSNTPLAEKLIPEHELRRLRNVALRMLERIKVGPAGITQALVDSIHEKWKLDEVVKLKFEQPLSQNMKWAHEVLEVSVCTLSIVSYKSD